MLTEAEAYDMGWIKKGGQISGFHYVVFALVIRIAFVVAGRGLKDPGQIAIPVVAILIIRLFWGQIVQRRAYENEPPPEELPPAVVK